ncbi:membrane metallo-endopeptidase-like 1 [Dinothrombium tinctorium]|uniref:Membrane metallo-endopeptidase-like 1 n=1 Tax=Dinothrombium tinctorium TaxID=1965070 RepID=A0A443Q9K8_9ACAR|nr:membrane metallo-endopeptidase-like 1 [Dinothrombium tinctorium]
MAKYITAHPFAHNIKGLDKIYDKISFVSTQNYADGYLKLMREFKRFTLRSLKEDIDEIIQKQSRENAYNPAETSTITLIGALQRKLFVAGAPLSVNFGRVAFLAGQESIQGFEDGRISAFDYKGEQINWWHKNLHFIYENGTPQCFDDYNSSIIDVRIEKKKWTHHAYK